MPLTVERLSPTRNDTAEFRAVPEWFVSALTRACLEKGIRMIQPEENWADIRGQVVQLHELSEAEPFLEAELLVEVVKPVAGFANLFTWAPGQRIRVRIPRDQARSLGLGVGQSLDCRVQKTGPQNVYAHPDHIKRR